MSTFVITGAKADTDSDVSAFLDHGDARALRVMAGDILRFNPNASATFTLNNVSLQVLGRLESHPANASIVHELVIAGVDEFKYSGGIKYEIMAVATTGDPLTRVLTLQLRAGQTSHNLTPTIAGVPGDKITLQDFDDGEWPAANTGTGDDAEARGWVGAKEITAIGAPSATLGGTQTVTVKFTSDPGSPGLLRDIKQTQSRLAGGTPQAPVLNDKGVYIMGGGVADIIGTTRTPWTRAIGSIVDSGSGFNFVDVVDNVVGWLPNDEIVIAPSDYATNAHTHYDYRLVSSVVSGGGVAGSTRVNFTTMTSVGGPSGTNGTHYSHPNITIRGETFTTEVMNLTRNFIVRGSSFTQRAHFMIMNSTPVVQTMKYGRCKWLGPRERANNKPYPADSIQITGRWGGLHWHMMKQNSVGSIAEGWVVTNAGSHSYVAHGSDGVTNLKCISHDTLEEPFWWDTDFEEDSPRDSVWDQCIGSLVAGTGPSLNNRLTAFQLGGNGEFEPFGSIVRDSVGVGVKGKTQQNGFAWNQVGVNSGGWITEGRNIAHNNQTFGVFTWNNGPRFVNKIENMVIYRNGKGIHSGAYGPTFRWINCLVAENGWMQADFSTSTVSSLGEGNFEKDGEGALCGMTDMYIDAANQQAHIITTSIIATEQERPMNFRDSDWLRPRVAYMLIQAAIDAEGPADTFGFHRDLVRIRAWDVGASVPRDLVRADFLEVQAPHDSHIRVQSLDDSSAFEIYTTTNSNFFYHTIPPFALAVDTSPVLPAATQGVPYSLDLAVRNPENPLSPITWRLKAGALPPGFALDTDGTLHASSPVTGTYSFTVEAKDSFGLTAPKELALSVGATASLTITTTTVPDGVVGTAYSTPIIAVNGTAPRTFSVFSGTLPPGLSLTTGGVLQGNPTTADSYSFVIRVTDFAGAHDNQAFSMAVADLNPVITTTSLADGEVALPYSRTLLASQGTPPYTWSLQLGPLPPGLTFSSLGVLSGTPTPPGGPLEATNSYPVRIRVTDSLGRFAQRDYTIQIFGVFAIVHTAPIPAEVGQAYIDAIDTLGGSGASFDPIFTLPPGIFFDANGVFTGTPTEEGHFPFEVFAHDSLGAQDSFISEIVVNESEIVVGVVAEDRIAFANRHSVQRSRQ